jgi:hypothetical protein
VRTVRLVGHDRDDVFGVVEGQKADEGRDELTGAITRLADGFLRGAGLSAAA